MTKEMYEIEEETGHRIEDFMDGPPETVEEQESDGTWLTWLANTDKAIARSKVKEQAR